MFKIIDLTKKPNIKRKTNRVINFKTESDSANDFDKIDSGISDNYEFSEENSLFKELNEKFENFNKNSDNSENFLTFTSEEKVMIKSKLSEDMETSDVFREQSREIENYTSTTGTGILFLIMPLFL